MDEPGFVLPSILLILITISPKIVELTEYTYWLNHGIRTDTKKIGQRQKWLLINIFHFSSDFDESWWDCSTHEYYNVTNFHQNWMKNRNLLLHACFWLCPIFFVSDLSTSFPLFSFFNLPLIMGQIFCSRGRPVEQFYWTSSRF